MNDYLIILSYSIFLFPQLIIFVSIRVNSWLNNYPDFNISLINFSVDAIIEERQRVYERKISFLQKMQIETDFS